MDGEPKKERTERKNELTTNWKLCFQFSIGPTFDMNFAFCQRKYESFFDIIFFLFSRLVKKYSLDVFYIVHIMARVREKSLIVRNDEERKKKNVENSTHTQIEKENVAH